MPIRLYLNTSDPESQEIAADVTKGTFEKLIDIGKQSDLAPYDKYLAKRENDEILKLSNFLLYGFGNFNMGILKNRGLSLDSGKTKNIVISKILLISSVYTHTYAKFEVLEPVLKKYGTCWF